MPQRAPYAKIAITLPQEDLAAADRLAAAQDRSRSWIIAEAIRQYVANASRSTASGVELDPSRREQLRRDLALSPQQRIEAGEEALRMVGHVRAAAPAPVPMSFASFDAFLAWMRERSGAP
jgi:predicted transcriptional regulator